MIQPLVAQTGKKCHRAIIYAHTKYDVLINLSNYD